MLLVAPASANPTGGNVVGGNVTITQTSPNRVDINQTSAKGIINWQNFSIGSGELTNFNQPSASAITLNRVVTSNPSSILGRMTANGRVWLVNPNGVFFGPNAQINVGGLLATTHDIANADFMAGNYKFQSNTQPRGIIENQGQITAAEAGLVAFVAPAVVNSGVITARLGEVTLASGNKFTVDLYGDQMINLALYSQVTGQVVDRTGTPVSALVKNTGQIFADGGRVQMTAAAAKGVVDNVMSIGGVVQARSVEQKNGEIILSGGDGGATQVTGTLDASGKTAGQKGGAVVVTGQAVSLTKSALIDVSGAAGGGQALIGGDFRGGTATPRDYTTYAIVPPRKPVPPAQTTTVAPGATIQADALVRGKGGEVVVWSDTMTAIGGTLVARGGPQGGDGGFIETSAKQWLSVTSPADASAAKGKSGTWLLDPADVTINASNSGGSWSSGTFTSDGGADIIDATVVGNALSGNAQSGTAITHGTNITINSGGDITVAAAITKTSDASDATLTLRAAKSIEVDQPISCIGSTTGKLHVVLDADSLANGGGIVLLNADITTNGGDLSFGTGRTALIGGTSTLVGGDVYVAGTVARTISTSGGKVDVNGEMLIANTSGLTINSDGGNVRFWGLLNSANSYAGINRTFLWGDAVNNAKSGIGSAVGDTYLATITTRLENAVASRAVNYNAAWLGAERVTDIGTDALWRWVTGPEHLENGGNGRVFFTQNGDSTTNGSGGTASNGGYSNWATGEPNNAGGADLSAANENVLQFVGATGQWNDLPRSNTLQWYVKETNLASSPLTINSGSGSVIFSGAVGNSKTLAALTVTANGGITISGGLTVSGNVRLATTDGAIASGDMNISGNVSTTAPSSSIALVSGGNININASISANTITLTGGNGKTVSGNGNITAAQLLLNGNGATYTMNTASGNNVGTLAATGTAAISFLNSAALTVGSVTVGNSTYTGVNSTGAVDLETVSGNLVVSGSITTTNATNSALVLNSGNGTVAGTPTGGDIVISGSPTISVGSGGIAKLYSGSYDTTGGGSGSAGLVILVGSANARFRYSSNMLTTSYTKDLIAGLNAIFRESPTLTISPSAYSTTYGATVSPTTFGIIGGLLVNGDTSPGTINASVASSGTSSSSPGSYNLSLFGLSPHSSLGYALIGASNTGGHTISSAPLTVTANSVAKTYDGNSYSGGGGVTYSGFVNNQTSLVLGGTLGYTGTSQGAVNVGKYVITPQGLTSGNYAITYVAGALTVNPAALAITANNASKTYGDTPTFATTAFTSTGLLNNDGVSGVTLTSSGMAATAAVGSYSITPGAATGTGLGNYTITYLPGTLSVSKAHLTVTANDATKTYGDSNPTFTSSISGFVNGESSGSAGITGSPSLTTAATAASGVGTVDITAALGGLSSKNYDFTTFINGRLTITPKAVTWAVASAISVQGTLAVLGTASLNGVLAGDNIAGLVGIKGNGGSLIELVANTPAGSYSEWVTSLTGSAAGNYILASTGNQPGILTINSLLSTLPQTVVAPYVPSVLPPQGPANTSFVGNLHVTAPAPASTIGPAPDSSQVAALPAPSESPPTPDEPSVNAPSPALAPRQDAGTTPAPSANAAAASNTSVPENSGDTQGAAPPPPVGSTASAPSAPTTPADQSSTQVAALPPPTGPEPEPAEPSANTAPPALAPRQNATATPGQNGDNANSTGENSGGSTGALASGQDVTQSQVASLSGGLVSSLQSAGLPADQAAGVAAGVMVGMGAAMANGVSPETAAANAQAAATSAAAQLTAATTADAGSPATALGSALAGSGAGLAQAVDAALGGSASSASDRAVGMAAVETALAGGANMASALASAQGAVAASQQQQAASTVPLTPAAAAMASLASEGNTQAALASLTNGLNDDQKAAFVESLSSLMAQGEMSGQTTQLAMASAVAAGQQADHAAVPPDRASTLIQSMTSGLSPDGLLAALGITGGTENPAGKAAIDRINKGLAEGGNPATVMKDALDGAQAASDQVAASTVLTKDREEVLAFAGGADTAHALAAFASKLDIQSPGSAAMAEAMVKALVNGQSGVAVMEAGLSAERAAAAQLAASTVPMDPRSRLITAIATGRDVMAVAEETFPVLIGRTGDASLLFQTLFKSLANGADLTTAVDAVFAQAEGAARHLAASSQGVPPPDPELVARATGTLSPPASAKPPLAVAASN